MSASARDRVSVSGQRSARNAALPGDRIETLTAFHDRGIFTWVSLEPTVDAPDLVEIDELVRGADDLNRGIAIERAPISWKRRHRVKSVCRRRRRGLDDTDQYQQERVSRLWSRRKSLSRTRSVFR